MLAGVLSLTIQYVKLTFLVLVSSSSPPVVKPGTFLVNEDTASATWCPPLLGRIYTPPPTIIFTYKKADNENIKEEQHMIGFAWLLAMI